MDNNFLNRFIVQLFMVESDSWGQYKQENNKNQLKNKSTKKNYIYYCLNGRQPLVRCAYWSNQIGSFHFSKIS